MTPETTLYLAPDAPASFNEVARQSFTGGAVNSFTTIIGRIPAATRNTSDVLSSVSNNNNDPLLKRFLSGNDNASSTFLRSQTTPIDYTKLGNVLLFDTTGSVPAAATTTTTHKGIIDNYIAPRMTGGAAGYTFNTVEISAQSARTSTYKITEEQLWRAADAGNDGSFSNATSALGLLLKDQLLIRKNELFVAGDFTSGPAASSASLYWLVSQESSSNRTLTPAELTRKNQLLSKNLRFFGAFLVEYCYYRSIYYRLLKQYYSAYGWTDETANTSWTTDFNRLYTSAAGAVTTVKTKAQYLGVLIYQMAVIQTRMNDMLRLLSKITDYYNGIFSEINATISGDASVRGSTTNLEASIKALNDSTDTVKKYSDQTDFRKEIINYTEQKNRYANMLLGLYAFLNISALAAIFHLSQGS